MDPQAKPIAGLSEAWETSWSVLSLSLCARMYCIAEGYWNHLPPAATPLPPPPPPCPLFYFLFSLSLFFCSIRFGPELLTYSLKLFFSPLSTLGYVDFSSIFLSPETLWRGVRKIRQKLFFFSWINHESVFQKHRIERKFGWVFFRLKKTAIQCLFGSNKWCFFVVVVFWFQRWCGFSRQSTFKAVFCWLLI